MSPYIGVKFNNFLSLAIAKEDFLLLFWAVYLVTLGVTNNYLLVNQISPQRLLQLEKGKQSDKQKSTTHSSLKKIITLYV